MVRGRIPFAKQDRARLKMFLQARGQTSPGNDGSWFSPLRPGHTPNSQLGILPLNTSFCPKV